MKPSKHQCSQRNKPRRLGQNVLILRRVSRIWTWSEGAHGVNPNLGRLGHMASSRNRRTRRPYFGATSKKARAAVSSLSIISRYRIGRPVEKSRLHVHMALSVSCERPSALTNLNIEESVSVGRSIRLIESCQQEATRRIRK